MSYGSLASAFEELKKKMNIQGRTEIPGLYATDQNNQDWSNATQQQQQTGNDANQQADAINSQAQNNTILLRGKSLLTDLTLERDNLDQGFVHSRRLLDAGILINAHCCSVHTPLPLEIQRVKLHGEDVNPANQGMKQSDKVYVNMKDQKQASIIFFP